MKSTVRNFVSAGLICGAAIMMTAVGAWAADAAAGKTLYGTKCKSCHGADGAGNPAMYKALKAPAVKSIAGTSEDTVKTAVTKGTGVMKPVAGVAGADLDNIAAAVAAMK